MRRLAVFVVILLLVPSVPLAAAEDLQALIDAAEPGSVLVLQAGTYDGNVKIDKPLEIRGEGWPVIDGHGTGNVIEILSPDVKLTGLVIANTGLSLDRENAGVSGHAERIEVVNNRFENVLFGVFLRNGDESVITDNVIGAAEAELARRGDGIRLWESPRAVIERNIVDGGRDTVLWFSDDLVLRDNRVTNGRYGIHFMYSDRALVERNYLSGNSVGGFLMYSQDLTLKDNLITNNYGPSGYGIGLKDMDGVEVVGNHMIGNRVGIYLDNSPATPGIEHQFEDNLFAYNKVGLLFLPSVSGNILVNNAFVDNREQVGVQGSGEFLGQNVWTVDGVGNHWSDFAGYDADGDGLGDVPHNVSDLFSTITDKNPDLEFFEETPASRAINLAGHMFPAFRPRPKLTDTAPIIELPDLTVPVSASLATASGPGAAPAAALMLAGALGLLFMARRPLRRPR